jgi:hypothetical protein
MTKSSLSLALYGQSDAKLCRAQPPGSARTLKDLMPTIRTLYKPLGLLPPKLVIHLAKEQSLDDLVVLTDTSALPVCDGRRILVKPDGCAATVEFKVQKPDATCETVRADLSDRLSAVLQRCHPGGHFVLSLEGEPKPLDLDLQVGEVGICSNDKLIVALAPPPAMVPLKAMR